MWHVAALYRFVGTGSDLPGLQSRLKQAALAHDICGTLLLAPEGINGTIGAPSAEQLASMMSVLQDELNINLGEVKYSRADDKPFLRMKVRLKKEIVTLRAPEANPAYQVGTYVDAQKWNDLISRSDMTVLDTRNTYETDIGIFKGAIDPRIETFTQFKDFVQKNLNPSDHPKIAMFCTGGIRCEKASSYMLSQGFKEVYHLKGGILKYLETVPEQESLWEGGCFVFDRRVAITHGLAETDHDLCYGCRAPLSAQDRLHPAYEEGVACANCADTLTPLRRKALKERHIQMTRQSL
ncbi:MAG: rhodanese-related sulfurtransferase [Alphaproteobacteria bacterium]|nr:rhodanese-related sulfurtransferase [Alphaproteobacteria bacterium]